MQKPHAFLVALAIVGSPMVRADAIAEMTEKATAGDVASQMALADHYITGDGVRTDMVAAVKWLTMAAEHGDTAAQMKLGSLLMAGRQVRKDSTAAATWFSMAAQTGDPAAQSQMARMHMMGAGVPRDDVEAYKWAVLAATQHNATGKLIAATLEKRMTEPQLAVARERAHEFLIQKKAEIPLPPLDLPLPDEPAPLLLEE